MYLTINFLIILMVSVQQVISQRTSEVSQFESQLQKQSKLISEQERRVLQQERKFRRETAPVPLTIIRQAALARQRGVGRTGVIQAIKKIRREKKALRKKTKPQFTKAKEDIQKARKQIISQRKRTQPLISEIARLKEFERGRILAVKGRSPIGLETETEREGFRFGRAQFRVGKERVKFFKEKITKRKLKPIKFEKIKKLSLISKSKKKKIRLPKIKRKRSRR